IRLRTAKRGGFWPQQLAATRAACRFTPASGQRARGLAQSGSMTNPVLAALAQARLRDAPMFVKWCELNGVASCPAAPATVARFVNDCASLGIERLWPAVQQISKMHTCLGLADPTLGGMVAVAISRIAGISPPRSWPDANKERFRSLPYDVQAHVACHDTRRER